MDEALWMWVTLLVLGGQSLALLFLAVAQVRFWQVTPRLEDAPPELPGGAPWPRVSVLVPSCNEEEAVEQATRTLLAVDYPALEVVAIDDRSTDRTGAILDRLSTEHPGRLKVVHITQLPDGWLGKNHANDVGARQASGDWLLFTDGDVMFAPDAIKRAVSFAYRCGLGHLAGLPRLVCPGFWERAAQSGSVGMIATRFRLWSLSRPRTPGFVGIGAFNLVRREDYLAVGGHTPLALEVADDMKLGMLLRRNGVAQGCVDTGERVAVRWQAGWWGTWRGMLKNGFAAMNFSWLFLLAAVAALLGTTLAPVVALAVAPWWWARALGAWCVLGPMVLHGYSSRRAAGGSGLEGVAQPLATLCMAGTLLWSAWITTRQGGVMWRGTLYPLQRLKAGVVDESRWPLDKVVGWDPTRLRSGG